MVAIFHEVDRREDFTRLKAEWNAMPIPSSEMLQLSIVSMFLSCHIWVEISTYELFYFAISHTHLLPSQAAVASMQGQCLFIIEIRLSIFLVKMLYSTDVIWDGINQLNWIESGMRTCLIPDWIELVFWLNLTQPTGTACCYVCAIELNWFLNWICPNQLEHHAVMCAQLNWIDFWIESVLTNWDSVLSCACKEGGGVGNRTWLYSS